MEIPCQWFLTFEGPNRECDYPFHAKVTGLHLDSTMRPKGCRIHVWSKSALQWALHVRCDITKTYLFWSSCISQVPYNNYRRVSTLGQCHESCNLFRCEGCGWVHNERNSRCQDVMQNHICLSYHHHQWCQTVVFHHTPKLLLHAYCANLKRRCTARWCEDVMNMSILWYRCESL